MFEVWAEADRYRDIWRPKPKPLRNQHMSGFEGAGLGLGLGSPKRSSKSGPMVAKLDTLHIYMLLRKSQALKYNNINIYRS
jgi:hypothetical protein